MYFEIASEGSEFPEFLCSTMVLNTMRAFLSAQK